MRTRTAWLAGGLVLSLGGFAALSWTRGQEGAPAKPVPTASPEAERSAPLPAPPAQDLSKKLPPLQRQMYLSACRGAEWLYRQNGVQGRFAYGYLPALNTPMEGDHYLRQIGAAFALARAARFNANKDYAARATQAVLALLGDTVTEPQNPQVRHTQLPSAVVNRLAAAGLLVLAINELPAPQPDLLEQSEQLCNYIRLQQQPDGSLSYTDSPDEKLTGDDVDGVNYYPGEALYGLVRSQQARPAAWKLDVLRRALAYYQPWWRVHKNMAFVPWHTAAYTEAFLLTKEPAFAAWVHELNDWICGLQYVNFDARHPLWEGGFMGWTDGKPVNAAPQISSASYAEGLAEACRVAREQGDLAHYRQYSEALEHCLQFLTTLQYTDANTTHFAPWYRPKVLGAFHASDQDGNLRIDYTQHAVSALVQYLTYVAKVQ